MATRTKEPEIKLTPQAMQLKSQRAMRTVHETKSKAELQRQQEWERYLEAKKRGDVKAANEALKMWNFINKMCQLADRFVVALERVQSIQSLFDMLESTTSLFTQIMTLDNTKVMRDMKKNLKLFKKKLKQYEQQMTDVFDLLDNLFDERPNAFVRFFNRLFGKKEKSPEEVLMANEAAFGAEMAAYGKEYEGTTEDTGATPPPAPDATPKGGFTDDGDMPDVSF